MTATDMEFSSELLFTGSSKDIYKIDGGLMFEFTDRMSVFDAGFIPELFPGLGAMRCAVTVRLFGLLRERGVITHYIEKLNDTAIKVYAYDVPEKNLYFGSTGKLLPLEFLFRFVATDTFCKRVTCGEVDLKRVSDSGTIHNGMRLKEPFLECRTKYQSTDTYLVDIEAGTFLHSILFDAATILQSFFKSKDFKLIDGKFEVARTHTGRYIIVDSLSPDELRLFDEKQDSYDKDPIRRWYMRECPEWYDALQNAKKQYPNDKSRWPRFECSPPDDVRQRIIKWYGRIADAVGAY